MIVNAALITCNKLRAILNETLLEILASSQFELYTLYFLLSVSSNFLYSNRLFNFSDIFYYFCEGKIPTTKRLSE